ncbi:MAG: transposase [Candidatus Bathyarchaeia archaeon]
MYSVVEIVLSVPFVYEVNDEVRKLLEDFRRLQFYIEYKAKLERLPVAYVKPKHTSSLCPICGGKLASNGYRLLKCKDCGYENDRDVIACVNLLRMRGAPVAPESPQ